RQDDHDLHPRAPARRPGRALSPGFVKTPRPSNPPPCSQPPQRNAVLTSRTDRERQSVSGCRPRQQHRHWPAGLPTPAGAEANRGLYLAAPSAHKRFDAD
ncbi:MAG: hypothetical protein J7458_01975, partial [Caldilinea sp.]